MFNNPIERIIIMSIIYAICVPFLQIIIYCLSSPGIHVDAIYAYAAFIHFDIKWTPRNNQEDTVFFIIFLPIYVFFTTKFYNALKLNLPQSNQRHQA